LSNARYLNCFTKSGDNLSVVFGFSSSAGSDGANCYSNLVGKFFIKESELRRKYQNIRTKTSNGFEVKENCWFRRNPSLTRLYYHFSNYGESAR
jgi:hypothetical protein